jgi:hypothetical protein
MRSVAGRFTIERHVGTGGMGSVHYARDDTTGRPVALKVLHDGAMNAVDVERFNREASILAELDHPGIVRYVAHGVDNDGAPYLAMEWVEGITLAQRLAHPISSEQSLALVAAVAAALGAAHERGIVHRDVKPSNIVLEGGDVHRPRLLDFGIARVFTSRDHALTQTGAIIGTPGYMAPEQARGMTELDPRADVYALGCLLFRCLGGRTPFAGAQAVAVLARTIIEDAPRLRELCPDAAPGLDELVARLLAREPSSRPSDGAAVVAAIEALAADDETEAQPLSVLVGIEAITDREQRFVTAVLGSPGVFDLNILANIASAHDSRFEPLADGSFLFVFATASMPRDLAIRACHAAMAVRARHPEVASAIVSGHTIVRRSVPIGPLLDRAARSMTTARAGAIAIDDNTASLVRDGFVLANEGGVTRIERAISETTGVGDSTVLGRPTPCVGRDRELAFLEGLVAESVEENVARLALIVAPPGTGKTRLRRELALRMSQRDPAPLVLLAVGDPLTSAPLGMLGGALRRAAGCFDLASLSDEANQLARWLGRRIDPDRATIASLLEMANVAVRDARERRATDSVRNTTLHAWLQWLGAELDAGPVVIMFEDLHWGDQPTVEFLDASFRAFAKKPLTALAFARPEVKTAFPRLWEEREPHELRLGPLTRAASAALVRAIVGKTDEATLTLLVDRAGGNAFFLEELIRTLDVGGVNALPDTVLAVIQARLASLGPELTRVLRAASVFGDTFWQEGLAALLGVGGESRRLAMWLTTLAERELVERRRETTLPGARQLVFRHALVREGAYAMLTDEDRQLGHRLAGEWLESQCLQEAAVLAEHYDRARDVARAIHWSCIDAERAIDTYDASAFRRAERGVRLGATGIDLGRLLVVQALALDRRLDPRAGEIATQALPLLPRATTDWYRAMSVLIECLGKDAAADRFGDATVTLAKTVPPHGDVPNEVEYVVSVARAVVLAGRLERSATIPVMVGALGPYFPRADELPPRAGACLELVLSMGCAVQKRPEAALQAATRALELTRDAGELTHEAELNLAQRLAFVGALDEALAILERVEVEAERLGVEMTTQGARLGRLCVIFLLEDYERAYELGNAVWSSDRISAPMALRADIVIATCALRTGRIAKAKELLATSPTSTLPLGARLELVRAEALLMDGRAHDAAVVVEQTLPLLQPTPFEQDDASFALLLGRALLASGEVERARGALSAGIAELQSTASSITDSRLRQSFLSRLADHKRLLALGAEHGL